jgi:hypothetical protein
MCNGECMVNGNVCEECDHEAEMAILQAEQEEHDAWCRMMMGEE